MCTLNNYQKHYESLSVWGMTGSIIWREMETLLLKVKIQREDLKTLAEKRIIEFTVRVICQLWVQWIERHKSYCDMKVLKCQYDQERWVLFSFFVYSWKWRKNLLSHSFSLKLFKLVMLVWRIFPVATLLSYIQEFVNCFAVLHVLVSI